MMADVQIIWTNLAVDGLTHYAPWNAQGQMQDGHVESMNCWCAPDLQELCLACRGHNGECWRCGGQSFIDGTVDDLKSIRRVVHRNFNDD